jgi:predicted transcriptional regulator
MLDCPAVVSGQNRRMALGRLRFSTEGSDDALRRIHTMVWIDSFHGLTYLDLSRRCLVTAIKISSKVDESVWRELRAIAEESHQSIGGLLTEAIRDYVRRRRIRPEVVKHLDDSMAENEELGRLLAQ